jgi:hypothetical protein
MRWIEHGRTYESRAHVLKGLGFSSYQDYLASDLWRQVREKVFSEKGRKCFMCGLAASQVHHNRYHRNDFLGKRSKYLNPVCGTCHVEIEFDGERKRTLAQAKVEFTRKRRKNVKAVKEATNLLKTSHDFYYEQGQHMRAIRSEQN